MNAAAAAEVLPAEPMTLEAWADMDEDEPGEFVDGQLVEEEVPSNLHEIVVSWLIEVLRVWGRSRACPVLGSDHKLALSPRRGRKPDVTVYPRGTWLQRKASLSRKPPMLIVEVVSPRPRDVKRDRHEKRNEYAQFGVQHYWLVDPEARVIEFLALGPNGRWDDAWSASDGRVDVSGFEGLTLDLDQLWAEVDAFTRDDVEDEGVESGET